MAPAGRVVDHLLTIKNHAQRTKKWDSKWDDELGKFKTMAKESMRNWWVAEKTGEIAEENHPSVGTLWRCVE